MERIGIRDARYLFGRHVVDLARIEPVNVLHNESWFWLSQWSDNHYYLLPAKSLSIWRDNNTMRPWVSSNGTLMHISPSKV